MKHRTNLLWKGELLIQIATMVVVSSPATIMPIYFLWRGGENLEYAVGILVFGVLILSLAMLFLRWMWQMRNADVQWLLAHPARWLLHWHYEQASWQHYARSERNQNLLEWAIIATFFAVISLITMITTSLGSIIEGILYCLIAYAIIVVPLLFLQVLLPYVRILYTAPEAYVTRSEVCIGGNYYNWRNSGAVLIDVQLHGGDPYRLELTIALDARRRLNVRIPVPLGQESSAQQVVDELSRQIEGDTNTLPTQAVFSK